MGRRAVSGFSSHAGELEDEAGRDDSRPPAVPQTPREATRVWRRLRSHTRALFSACFSALLLILCFAVEPILEWVPGHGPNDPFPYGTATNLKPVGPLSWVPDTQAVFPEPTAATPHTLFILGADGPLG